MTPREAINEIRARAAVLRADVDDDADALEGAPPDVVPDIRREMGEKAREIAALEMAVASLEAFGGVDEATLAPAMREALGRARRDFPAASIVLLGFARVTHGGDTWAAPVLRLGRAGAETAAALMRRGFLVWGREA